MMIGSGISIKVSRIVLFLQSNIQKKKKKNKKIKNLIKKIQ